MSEPARGLVSAIALVRPTPETSEIDAEGAGMWPARTSQFRLRTVDDVLNEPPAEWLIHGVIPMGGAGMLYGPPGCGKSLLALDLALCVATGTPWCSRAVKRGHVVYLALEGRGGLSARVRAWDAMWGKLEGERTPIRFLYEAPDLLDSDRLADLAHTIRREPVLPTLLVIDTVARAAVGIDENSAQDVGRLMEAVDVFRRRVQYAGRPDPVAALLVHHSQKNGPKERGSSAFRAACEFMLPLEHRDTIRVLTIDKQRDGVEGERFAFQMHQSGPSVVLVRASDDPALDGELTPKQLHALDVLHRTCVTPMDGASATEWERASQMPASTFYEARKALIAKGLVAQGRARRYSVSPEGLLQLQGHSK